MSTSAEDVKKLLSGTVDEKLNVIERQTKERLSLKLGTNSVPQALSYITFEVMQKRFNRIGNEGMQSYSQEGLSMSFPDSDFDEYEREINEWKNRSDEDSKRGRFRLY